MKVLLLSALVALSICACTGQSARAGDGCGSLPGPSCDEILDQYYATHRATEGSRRQHDTEVAVPYSAAQGRTEVAISRSAGTAIIPVIINGTLRLGFIVDSGASNVVIPADVVMTLFRTGTLSTSDFLGKRTYVLADGSKLPSVTFRIRSLKVGDKVLENVIGSASPILGDPLLGQSFLSRFQSWSIDNARGVLVLE